MNYKGFAYKFSDNINTDFIISGRYKFSITDLRELSQYIFEDIRPNFSKEIKRGKSIIVAGENFGMGSSREQAPWVIKEAGIICVVANNFARIFYRNSFNIGLPLIEADTSEICEGDLLEVDVDKGLIKDLSKNLQIKFLPWSKFQKELIRAGGIINYLEKHKGFPTKL
ncbi:MAG TPA: 3-isopropylmalate dehydratase [Candidatus Omnitrophica bacterium]|nr:MAG: 3-isopropylmalate dehydratase [Candidatus Omnitrophota bacterium]RKY43319.1 MAG: 3-isopropylmalate dehydratase [Candidatus Omnitrophota bacterium]HEC69822.1 3-isopropylmalate dehydratase [Candidatus Omnitrophota bacterium]